MSSRMTISAWLISSTKYFAKLSKVDLDDDSSKEIIQWLKTTQKSLILTTLQAKQAIFITLKTFEFSRQKYILESHFWRENSKWEIFGDFQTLCKEVQNDMKDVFLKASKVQKK